MVSSFKPFLISEFKTGLFSYLQPWISPVEAFNPMSNAYIYRGQVNKRNGYLIFGRMSYRDNNIDLGDGGTSYGGTILVHPIVAGSITITAGAQVLSDPTGSGLLTGNGTGTINYTTGVWTAVFNLVVAANVNIYAIYNPEVARPIMGLKSWTSEADGSSDLLAFDTRRASVYNEGTKVFDPLSSVSQVIFSGDASTTTIDIFTGWVSVSPYTNAIAPFSVTITDGTDTIQDDGAGTFLHNGNALPDGTNFSAATINYATGEVTATFGTAPAAGVNITIEFLLMGDYFTGTSSNFFNATNWIAPAYIPINPGYLYVINNKDRITTYDGTDLARPPFSITLSDYTSFVNDIETCLDIDIYKNRFTVQRPVLVTAQNPSYPNPSAQSIRWSAVNSPTNLAADVTGNGGEASAPTDDFIASSEFLRDELIIFFSNSTWKFQFTGNFYAPFQWSKINNTKSTGAPYGTVPYDERITAIGNKGLIATDGVNVQRYDNSIIDQFLSINQNDIEQCYGLRFDTNNQTWMLFPNYNSSLSNSALIYNFIENTWATYDIALSCLGLYFLFNDSTWADFSTTSSNPTTWEQADWAWDSYVTSGLAPILLAGSLSGGFIYRMDVGESDHPASNSVDVAITSSITSARWNPFMSIGQKVQFGYIDIYYEINTNCVLDLSFFVDNSEAPCAFRTLTLDGPANSSYTWKRIYINVVGEFLQMKIENSQTEGFTLLGMVLWASETGRLTPGRSVT